MHHLLGWAVLLALAVPARAHDFRFVVPPGWTDLSPGSPEASFAAAPDAFRQMAQSGQVAFLAADLGGAADGFIENANVRLLPGQPRQHWMSC